MYDSFALLIKSETLSRIDQLSVRRSFLDLVADREPQVFPPASRKNRRYAGLSETLRGAPSFFHQKANVVEKNGR